MCLQNWLSDAYACCFVCYFLHVDIVFEHCIDLDSSGISINIFG